MGISLMGSHCHGNLWRAKLIYLAAGGWLAAGSQTEAILLGEARHTDDG